MRRRYPDRIVVGMEPALRPAVRCGENSTVLVLATAATLHEEKFKRLTARYAGGARVIALPAPRNGESVVIFPEDSKNGYLPELEGFFAGFVMLAEVAFRKGLDVPIYVTYFKKKELIYVIDAPVKYSTLRAEGLSRDEIAARLLARCNELGRMTFDEISPEALTDADAAEEAVV